jgi:hypothetical protein
MDARLHHSFDIGESLSETEPENPGEAILRTPVSFDSLTFNLCANFCAGGSLCESAHNEMLRPRPSRFVVWCRYIDAKLCPSR